MDSFLGIAASKNVSVGFVFFDDCWNHQGASLDVPCTPQPGDHNGCWMASPQDVERQNGTEPFRAYVTQTVQRFRTDRRVRWWEIYNEPFRGVRPKSQFSLALRDAGYAWAKAVEPIQPVLSCWDDNPDTDIVDHHDYGTGFTKTWLPAL